MHMVYTRVRKEFYRILTINKIGVTFHETKEE
jgi:hypothetical protein